MRAALSKIVVGAVAGGAVMLALLSWPAAPHGCPQLPHNRTAKYACREYFRAKGLCSFGGRDCAWPYRIRPDADFPTVGKSQSWELFCMTVVDGIMTECVTLETIDRDDACGVVCDRSSTSEAFRDSHRSGLIRDWFGRVTGHLPRHLRNFTLAFSTADAVVLDKRGQQLAARLRSLGTPLYAGVITEEDHLAGVQYVPDLTFSEHLVFREQRLKIRQIVPTVDKAVWRGAASGADNFWLIAQRHLALGVKHQRGVLDVQRMRLVNISRARPEHLDAQISKLDAKIGVDEEVLKQAHAWNGGIDRNLPVEAVSKFQMQVSVDGFGTTAGLISKLHGRGVVLKVSSSAATGNLTEWWYHRIRPWVHYVPVNSNLSDLVQRIEWVRSHPALAQKIANNAVTTVSTITFEDSVLHGARVMKVILQNTLSD